MRPSSALAGRLSSMTGFAREEGHFEGARWVWEVRAVNGKALDMRLRLPMGYEILDPKIRKIVAAALHRGNLQINLTIHTGQAETNHKIDEDWLWTLVNRGEALVSDNLVKRARLDGLYQVPGVVQDHIVSVADPAFEKQNESVMDSLNGLMDKLKAARAQEGAALADMLGGIITAFEEKMQAAARSKGADAGYIQAKFETKFKALMGEGFSQDRLAQEAALLAVKADVCEELDRLAAHIDQARALIKKGSPVGRKLDFLAQEFIREVNTMCSKSMDIELTQIGLDMKSLIEQFREQAANVE